MSDGRYNIYVTYQYNGKFVQYHQNIEEEKLYNTCQKKSIIGLAGEEEKRKHLVEEKNPMETTAMQNVYV